ncbi:MAG: hypothetical protein ACJ8F1_06400 [Polyangia bacterium]
MGKHERENAQLGRNQHRRAAQVSTTFEIPFSSFRASSGRPFVVREPHDTHDTRRCILASLGRDRRRRLWLVAVRQSFKPRRRFAGGSRDGQWRGNRHAQEHRHRWHGRRRWNGWRRRVRRLSGELSRR